MLPLLRLALAFLLLASAGGCYDRAPEARSAGGTAGVETGTSLSVVLGADACRDAGYLCPGLAEREEPRVLRWSEETREITVHVPRPEVGNSSLGRSLQDAAARGILAWQNKPFPLRISRTGDGDGADVVVRWVEGLQGSELGRAETQWTRSVDGTSAMRVTDFVLSLQNPFDRARWLPAEQVQLTAAHEMGHALGLPHSDSDRDVMYPTNTASSLSPRDYQTMQALYALQNGGILGEEVLAGIRER